MKALKAIKEPEPSVRPQNHILTAALVTILLIFPVFIQGEWLSDVDNADNADNGAGIYNPDTGDRNNTDTADKADTESAPRKNKRGYFIPRIPESQYPKISLLQVGISKNNPGKVTISWKKPRKKGNYSYNIYRSTSIINTSEKLDNAFLVAKDTSGKGSASDTVQEAGTYYYAVSVIDKNNYEYFKPEYDQTFMADGISLSPQKSNESNLEPHINNLQARFNRGNRTITVRWKYAGAAIPGLHLYHKTENPIRNQSDLQKASLIRSIMPGKRRNSLQIKELAPGTHYFAMTSYSVEGKQNNVIDAGNNTTADGVFVPEKEPEVKPDTTPEIKTNVQVVYVTNVVTVDKFVTNEKSVEKPPEQPEQEVTNKEPHPEDQETDEYFQPEPVKVSETIRLRREIKSYLRNEDHNDGEGLLNNIYTLRKIQGSSENPWVKTQCSLFIGRAYFQLGRYRTAFKTFSSIQSELPEQSRYWMNQCINHMR